MKLKFNKVKFIVVFMVVTLIIVFTNSKAIMESKLGKAKMDIIKTLGTDEPDVAKENIKSILDSLMNPIDQESKKVETSPKN